MPTCTGAATTTRRPALPLRRYVVCLGSRCSRLPIVGSSASAALGVLGVVGIVRIVRIVRLGFVPPVGLVVSRHEMAATPPGHLA